MATIRPSLSEIIERIDKDAQARLDTEEYRRSDTAVFVRAIAGAAHGLYAAIEYGRRQLFIDSANTTYLERLASIFGLSRKQAAKATGTVTFTYSGEVVDVPLGILLKSANGYQYVTTSATDTSGVASVSAQLGGEAYDLSAGAELTMVSPITGVTGATVTTDITGGTELESDDSLRARTLAHTQYPPRQGTKEDYVAWALECAGVGYAWCFPQEMGDGTVTVRILDEDGELPTTELIETVRQYIISKTSVLATVYVEAPLEQVVNFTLKITPDTTATRAAAETALQAFFKKKSCPGGTLYLSQISAALSAVTNEEDHVIVSPTANIVAASNAYLPTLGEITWQED